MGTAAIARSSQFRHADFTRVLRRPERLENAFAGFYGSLEEVNATLRKRTREPDSRLRWTPGHLR